MHTEAGLELNERYRIRGNGRATLWRIALLVAILPVSPCARAEINLGAGIALQSPDGQLVQVNGGYVSQGGRGLGWIYDWGDGMLQALTETGAFHIELLHLNRSGLVANRRYRGLIQSIAQSQAALWQRIESLEKRVDDLVVEVEGSRRSEADR